MRSAAPRPLYTLVTALLLAGLAAAQESERAAPWRWSRFTTLSGLPSNRIDLLVEDGAGTPWVGTSFGLSWYDGFRWNPAPEIVPEKAPTSLEVMPDGRIAAVIESQVFLGDRNGFEQVEIEFDGRTVEPVNALPLPDGRLLIREHKTNLLVFWSLEGSSERLPPPSTAEERTIQVWAFPDGDIYLNTTSGLYQWADERWSLWIQLDTQESLFTVDEGPNGHGIAAVTLPRESFGVWTWEDSSPELLSGLGENSARDLAVSREGEFGIALAADSVLLFEGEIHKTISLPSSLHTIRLLRFRDNGDLWFGSNTGLFLYRKASTLWETLTPSESPSSVNEILAASDGTVWVANNDRLERWRDDQLVETIEEAAGFPIDRPTALGEDRLGRIWLGSGASISGALRWDGVSWIYVGEADGLGADYVHKIRKDARGRLWFLGIHHDALLTGPGAFVLGDDDRFTRWGTEEGLPSGRVYDFEEGPDGAYWFATLGGISRFQDDRWTHWTTDDGLHIDRVFTLAVEGSGKVWFGHQSWTGLGFIDGDRVGYEELLLPSDEVWELSVDEDRLWIGTSNGACLWRAGALICFAEGTGLDRARVWPIRPLADAVYFGTLNKGLVTLHLDQIDLAPPHIVINAPGDFERQKPLHWDVAAPDGWTLPEVVKTRFRFDDEPWSTWSLTREAPMPDEDATLTVQALGFLGDYNEPGTSRALRHARPLYKTPLFIGPIALLSVSVLTLVLILSARKRRHASELRASELRYRDLFENANDMIFTSDLAGGMTGANRKTRELLGITVDDVDGLRLDRLTTPDHRERYQSAIERVQSQGSTAIYELDLVAPSGKRVSLEINTRLVHEHGTPKSTQSVARDVTGRRELEVEQRQAHKMEALGLLAGGIAHDFNNVLSVILGYSDILLARVEEDTALRQHMIEIRNAGERAASLTRQLLAFSRKQMQRVEVFDLGKLITDMQLMLRPLLGEDVELMIERKATPASLELDPGQVQQIVLNLAANARDAMSQGGVLTITVDAVELTEEDGPENHGAPPGSYVVLIVSDTGSGIDPETQRQVFDPFFTTKALGKGTGLGLSSVYGVIQQSGGRIFVRSKPGEGASFHVLLPRTDKAPRTQVLGQLEPKGGPETVLVVEDEESVRTIMVNVLSSHGYNVFEAENAHQAQRVAREVGEELDLLVTDVVMPGMSGSELVNRLTATYPDLRVLYVSGYARDLPSQPSLGSDHDFLAKPFGVRAFARKVDEVFGRVP
jgi:PAS domain S-box-containing protein